MTVKAERDVLELLPNIAAKVKRAAEESIEAAKRARANARRDRITSRSTLTPTVPPPAPLVMPEEWRGDEDTSKFIIEDFRTRKA